eukprot:CAMPEP_0168180520 /NCGR_PEP_ID=MMETSP0139_2-20121125/10589_1 /TAXON_ID=44445 /ORGANISM="Pseudo-nitzschia australis, Strain 10249 10 AB" /LENGTH=32 /DNA_ID= /DNA_START= /DNA_END= /DNA_ORIENTATION=
MNTIVSTCPCPFAGFPLCWLVSLEVLIHLVGL